MFLPGMFLSTSQVCFQGIATLHRCKCKTQFSTVFDINNDEKAMGNHSEEKVLVISP
jgi:hypothetical protein